VDGRHRLVANSVPSYHDSPCFNARVSAALTHSQIAACCKLCQGLVPVDHLEVLLTPAWQVRHALNKDGVGPFQVLLPVLDLLLQSLHAGQTLLPVAALKPVQDTCVTGCTIKKANQGLQTVPLSTNATSLQMLLCCYVNQETQSWPQLLPPINQKVGHYLHVVMLMLYLLQTDPASFPLLPPWTESRLLAQHHHHQLVLN